MGYQTSTSSGTFDETKFLVAFGIFKIAPYTVKKNIYRKGKWLKSVDIEMHSKDYNWQWWSQIANLPFISQVNNKNNSLIWMVNDISHHPWTMSATCIPEEKGNSERDSSGIIKSHLQNEICAFKALAKWFDWMKEQGIYGNTRILIISDHDG